MVAMVVQEQAQNAQVEIIEMEITGLLEKKEVMAMEWAQCIY